MEVHQQINGIWDTASRFSCPFVVFSRLIQENNLTFFFLHILHNFWLKCDTKLNLFLFPVFKLRFWGPIAHKHDNSYDLIVPCQKTTPLLEATKSPLVTLTWSYPTCGPSQVFVCRWDNTSGGEPQGNGTFYKTFIDLLTTVHFISVLTAFATYFGVIQRDWHI